MNLQILVLVALIACLGGASAYSFDIEAHREQCFRQVVKQGTSIGCRFQVVSGGFRDIDIRITGPDGLIVYSGDRESEGKYSFISHTSGEFTFCFSNQMSTMTPKTVSFVISVGDEPGAESSKPATKDAVTPLENNILQLVDGLQAIHEEHEYLQIRERVHRNTLESTNSRVVWWTLFESFVLIGISAWQIWSIWRVFETKRGV